ncbi:MAG: hypothetical protein JJ974_06055 [Phycisphaerales bacterium]|nr:hypothetical protein [Phycisphaerales bacterium]
MRSRYQTRRGISLAETVVSTLLIGFVLVSTLTIVAPLTRSNTVHANSLVATNLARELSDEIATKAFIDSSPDSQDALGFDAGDSTFLRSTYDDIDDYHKWSSSPPKHSLGGIYTSMTGWTREVSVDHVMITEPSKDSPTYTGLKRVTVIVYKDGTALASMTTLHSSTADTLGFAGPTR